MTSTCQALLISYHKGFHNAGIKLLSTFPCIIRSLHHDMEVFKPALKDYLLTHSSYSVEEFTSTENSKYCKHLCKHSSCKNSVFIFTMVLIIVLVSHLYYDMFHILGSYYEGSREWK
jgi:hypothetical protein